jgi:hypothetical protein
MPHSGHSLLPFEAQTVMQLRQKECWQSSKATGSRCSACSCLHSLQLPLRRRLGRMPPMRPILRKRWRFPWIGMVLVGLVVALLQLISLLAASNGRSGINSTHSLHSSEQCGYLSWRVNQEIRPTTDPSLRYIEAASRGSGRIQ